MVKVFTIAEIGVNHNGSLKIAKEKIWSIRMKPDTIETSKEIIRKHASLKRN